jgi:hypothetical protein
MKNKIEGVVTAPNHVAKYPEQMNLALNRVRNGLPQLLQTASKVTIVVSHGFVVGHVAKEFWPRAPGGRTDYCALTMIELGKHKNKVLQIGNDDHVKSKSY